MDVVPVEIAHAPAVAELLRELGYPVSPEELATRLASLAPRPDDAAWVLAGGPESDPVGFVACHAFQPYELDRPVAEITALVVDPADRRAGHGATLVAAAEQWARDRACVRISLASSLHRTEAHAFYARQGYLELAKKLEKPLT